MRTSTLLNTHVFMYMNMYVCVCVYKLLYMSNFLMVKFQKRNIFEIKKDLQLIFYLEFVNHLIYEYNEVYLQDFHIHRNQMLQRKKKVKLSFSFYLP